MATEARYDGQPTKPRPREGKSVLKFRELGKMKNEMEKLKTVKPPLVIQPRLEEKQEEEEELDECFFDAVNNLELLSEAPPDPRPTSTAALPPSSSGQPSQDFPSSPGSPSSPTFSKAHLPSFLTPCPGLPSSPDLFSPELPSSPDRALQRVVGLASFDEVWQF